MDQPRNEAQTTKRDVDERVGGADARFDPDGYWGKEDGEKGEEDVGGAHLEDGSALMDTAPRRNVDVGRDSCCIELSILAFVAMWMELVGDVVLEVEVGE